MNKQTAASKLLNAYLRLRFVAKEFEEETGCGVCTRDWIQLGGTGVANRELVKLLGVNVEMEKLHTGYWEFSFTWQLVKFLWLEEATDEQD